MMVDLGRFTQVRPANFGNILQLAKRHIPILVDGQTISFYNEEDDFAGNRANARTYLEEAPAQARINAIADWLFNPITAPTTANTGLSNWPDKNVMHTAETLSWLPGKPVINRQAMAPLADFSSPAVSIEFASQLRLDLLALFINPGLYPDYRRLLSSLLRLCTLLSRDGAPLSELAQDVSFPDADDTTPHPEDVGTINSGSRLDIYLRARLLFPPHLHADNHPGHPVMSPSPSGVDHSTILTGTRLVQFEELLTDTAMAPASTDRPTAGAINVTLTQPGKEISLPKRPVLKVEGSPSLPFIKVNKKSRELDQRAQKKQKINKDK